MTPDQIKRFYWVMFGEDIEHPNPPEIEIVKQTGNKFTEQLGKKLGPLVAREIVTKTVEAGLPLETWGYVFWNLMERRSDWPDSLTNDQQTALLLALDLMDKAGKTPRYKEALQVPPTDLEPLVDDVIRNLAVWSTGTLTAKILEIYLKVTRKPARKIDKILRKRDKGMRGKGLVYLQKILHMGANQFHRWFKDPWILRNAIQVAFGD